MSDEEGRFYGVDARSGAIRWEVETRAASAAAAVGGNGDIYALQAFGPALIAIRPDGKVKWQSELQSLADARLPSSWLLGNPVAIGNGNPTVLDDFVLVPVAYGYQTELGRRIPWPVESTLVAVDIETGVGTRDVVSLADDSTGVTAVLPNGIILNSLGTAITSGIKKLASMEWLLPGDRELLEERRAALVPPAHEHLAATEVHAQLRLFALGRDRLAEQDRVVRVRPPEDRDVRRVVGVVVLAAFAVVAAQRVTDVGPRLLRRQRDDELIAPGAAVHLRHPGE